MTVPASQADSVSDRRGVVAAPGSLRIALIGNPNTGKSTLFNALTGLRQKVGNYSGVTVERVEGKYCSESGCWVTVVDLPGTYSLSATSPDEDIALSVLLGVAKDVPIPDVVVLVVDAVHLERNLFLTSQILEIGLPVVIALNQIDAAAASGIRVDPVDLALQLGVQVVETVATRGQGLEVLHRAVERAPELGAPTRQFTLPSEIGDALAPVEDRLVEYGFPPSTAGMEALRLLSVDPKGHLVDVAGLPELVATARTAVEDAGHHSRAVEAEARYGWIAEVVDETVHHRGGKGNSLTDRIDSVALHRFFGPLIFVALMAIVFQSIFTWAAPLMEWVEGLVGALGSSVGSVLPEGEVRSLIVDGVIAGVGAVVVFLPQIAILFLFIGFLEATGYMARAAFIMDRFMRGVGLHGKSFIPMLSGYACAVPGIMAARTIESPKDRLATIMVVPLMSCSARLPVYTLLIGTFIPPVVVAGVFNVQGLTLLLMYLLGTLAALAVAGIFKKTLLRGPVQPMIMELPPYRLPDPKSLFLSVWQRSAMFLRRAGTVILALSIILWALASYPKSDVPLGMTGEQAQEDQLAQSYLGRAGQLVAPVFAPLGYDWKISVSILSSFAAREVFVSTMGTIYGVGSETDETSVALRDQLKAERNAAGLPVYTPLVALGLMVFYVFAMMCMSTNAVVIRETGGGWTGTKWAVFQFMWMFALAYFAAYLVFQGGRALGFA